MKTNNLIFNAIFTIITSASISTETFAYVNNEAQNGLIAYCPEKVECAGETNSLICKGIGNNSQYWDWSEQNNNDKHWRKGTYIFLKAFDHFYMKTGDQLGCEYQYADVYPFPVDNVQLQPKDASHFMPLMKTSSIESNWPYYDNGIRNCDTNKTELCPFMETEGIKVFPKIINSDGAYIGNFPAEISVNGIVIGQGYYFSHSGILYYNDALKACGSVKQCVFYIRKAGDMSDNYFTMAIDLTDDMKIITITNPSNYPYKMIKNPLFNTIQWVQAYVK